jgi:cytochrome c553
MKELTMIRRRSVLSLLAVLAGLAAGCNNEPERLEAQARLVDQGKDVFRFDTFGDEVFWTDTLRLHEAVGSAVDPVTALSVGLKVDADVLPAGILQTADLHSPATTIALIKLNAVVGLKGTVTTVDGRDALTRLGVTCALCHSTVDNSVAPGIGHRLDGWPNRDLDPGAIIALSPALSADAKAVYRSWGPGRYDPRFNQDGKNAPVRIPPAYGLAGIPLATYTGDGDISYWNAYVAVTQMHGQGTFADSRLGIDIRHDPDLVTPKLPALRFYQESLAAPVAPLGSFDAAAAARGRSVFASKARCATCHQGTTYTDDQLHLPSEVGLESVYASRSATKRYRTTPLRALWQHAPYFHDGSAATLTDVVEHYDRLQRLGLAADEKRDLVEFLKSL